MWTNHRAYYHKDFRRIRQKKYPFAMSWNQSCKDPGSMDTMCDVRFTSLSHRPCVCFPCICYCFLYVKHVLSCSCIKCKSTRPNIESRKVFHAKLQLQCVVAVTAAWTMKMMPSWYVVISWTAMVLGHVKCQEGQKARECSQ
jgi:hypothetical protein